MICTTEFLKKVEAKFQRLHLDSNLRPQNLDPPPTPLRHPTLLYSAVNRTKYIAHMKTSRAHIYPCTGSLGETTCIAVLYGPRATIWYRFGRCNRASAGNPALLASGQNLVASNSCAEDRHCTSLPLMLTAIALYDALKHSCLFE